MKKFLSIIMSAAILLIAGCSSVQEPVTTVPLDPETITVGDVAGTIEGDRYISHVGGVAYKLTGSYKAEWPDSDKRSIKRFVLVIITHIPSTHFYIGLIWIISMICILLSAAIICSNNSLRSACQKNLSIRIIIRAWILLIISLFFDCNTNVSKYLSK